MNSLNRFESGMVGFMIGALAIAALVFLNDPYEEGFSEGYAKAQSEIEKCNVVAYNEWYQRGFEDCRGR